MPSPSRHRARACRSDLATAQPGALPAMPDDRRDNAPHPASSAAGAQARPYVRKPWRRSMKRHLAVLSATALALCGSPLWAQSPTGGAGGAGGGPGRRMEALLAGITLTEDQHARIDSINKHYRAKMTQFTLGSQPASPL